MFNKLRFSHAAWSLCTTAPHAHSDHETNSDDAAVKGKLTGAILGRLDEGHHHTAADYYNYVKKPCGVRYRG